jgi:PAS domain S-box-containing protein
MCCGQHKVLMPDISNDQTNGSQRRLELLVSTGLLLAKTADLQALVQSATDAGLELCGGQFGAFFYNVLNKDGESYLLHTLSGVDPEKFSSFPMPRKTAIFGPTFEGTAIVRSGDITKDPRYGHNAPYHGMPQGHVPVRSYLAVPVKAQTGEVLGGLFYGHENTDVFQQDAEDLIATIAAQAAIAIENFRLRDQLTRKVADLELAESQQQEVSRHLSELAAIVESSDDAILSKDLNGIIISWNHAAARLFGFTQQEIVGESILKLIPDELHPEEKTIIDKIRAGQRIEHFETTRLKKNGERFEASLSISPVRDRTGTIVGASKILRDISSRKRIEALLIQSEKIAATGRMAATIAHEVNNPLEAVMNLIYLARSNPGDSAQVDNYLRAAESEVVRVSHIARQTLGFYRENASAVSLSLAELAADAIRIYEPKCKSAGISVIDNLNSTRQVFVRKGEILQVISNLIANAIYAMPSGGTLSISLKDVDLPEGFGVALVVEDSGVGIDAEQLPRIFEAFFTTRTSIGTGIGLFVAKQFVEGHRGKITVASSTDPASHGTIMSVFLPALDPHATSQLSTDLESQMSIGLV